MLAFEPNCDEANMVYNIASLSDLGVTKFDHAQVTYYLVLHVVIIG
jgi:hypothetical protein